MKSVFCFPQTITNTVKSALYFKGHLTLSNNFQSSSIQKVFWVQGADQDFQPVPLPKDQQGISDACGKVSKPTLVGLGHLLDLIKVLTMYMLIVMDELKSLSDHARPALKPHFSQRVFGGIYGQLRQRRRLLPFFLRCRPWLRQGYIFIYILHNNSPDRLYRGNKEGRRKKSPYIRLIYQKVIFPLS